MAPEQWTGQPTRQSDLYSLGIVLYEMVAGRKPYMADTPASILLKQATETLPPPRKFVSGLPEAMEFLLIKALAREPHDRFTDVNALIQAMETLLLSAPTVQSGHADPDAALKETLAVPPAAAADAPAQIELQDGGETVLSPPSGASSSPVSKAAGARPAMKGQTGSARPIQRSRRVSQFGLFALFGGAGFFVLLGAVVLVLILMPSILPKSAEPVPTATVSPVPPTAYPTSTPSAIPTPVFGFTIVEPQEALQIAASLKTLTELAYEKYSDADHNKVNTTLTFTINSKPGVPMIWSSGWCAVNDQILEENLTKIKFVFEADGYVVPLERLAKNAYEVTEKDSNLKGWKCLEYLTVLRDWKPGTYKFVETITFSSAINDGKVAFDAGNMIRKYTVNISE
jgi:hypothetical protein